METLVRHERNDITARSGLCGDRQRTARYFINTDETDINRPIKPPYLRTLRIDGKLEPAVRPDTAKHIPATPCDL